MDGLLIIIGAFILTIRSIKYGTVEEADSHFAELAVGDTMREAKLNESFYEDPNAFSRIINRLGFPKS